MSIADQLNKMIPELEEAYTAIEEMGGTLPEQKNYKNLRVAIESIPSGAPNAYVFIYDPNKPEEVDYTDDAQDVINIMNGSGYLPNNGYTHIKFTPRCQELNITSIGSNVKLCPNIEVVEGLENFTKVTSIGSWFLSGTGSAQNTTLREVTALPPNVKTIASIFCYLDNFNSPVTFPDTVTAINTGAFVYCKAFNSPIHFSTAMTYLGSSLYNLDSFNQPIELPESLTYLGANSISHLPVFDQPITLPSKLTTVRQNFLYDCAKMNSKVTLPPNLTEIEYGSFRQMSLFNKEIAIPDTLTTIGANVFSGVYNFTEGLLVGTAKPTFETENAFIGQETSRNYTQGVNIHCGDTDTLTHWKAQLPNIVISATQFTGRKINWTVTDAGMVGKG